MIKLASNPVFVSGGLWFEIPRELQDAVVPMLKSKLKDVAMPMRARYRAAMSKRHIQNEKYSEGITAIGGFEFYCCYAEWRVGDRGIAACNMERVKAEILAELRTFSNVIEVEARVVSDVKQIAA